MQKTIHTVPAYLVSTYKLVQCAFPDGISEELYLPLLSVLYEHLSDRNLAGVIAEYTGKNYYVVLNDVYRVGARKVFPSEVIEIVKQRLMNCQYEDWLVEETEHIMNHSDLENPSNYDVFISY